MAAKRQELMISTVAQQSVPAGGMWVHDASIMDNHNDAMTGG